MKLDKKFAKDILVNLLIFISVVYAVHLYQTRNSPVGVAPEIKGYMLDGRSFKTALRGWQGAPHQMTVLQ